MSFLDFFRKKPQVVLAPKPVAINPNNREKIERCKNRIARIEQFLEENEVEDRSIYENELAVLKATMVISGSKE